MYYKKTIKAGKTKEVYKTYTKREGGKRGRGKRKKATEEEMKKINQLNAERKLRILLNANFKADDLFLTLTYQKEKRPSPSDAKKNIKRFLNIIRKEYQKQGEQLKYINVTEYASSAIHHHLVLNSIDAINVTKLIANTWEYGRPNFKLLDKSGQYKDLANYLIKETSKVYSREKDGHKQRYSCSRNLVRPKQKIEVIKARTWSPSPKTEKGYYLDKDSVINGIDFWTGKKYQRYILIEL